MQHSAGQFSRAMGIALDHGLALCRIVLHKHIFGNCLTNSKQKSKIF
jgi:hypothetical protein